jgi:hypothetical protein
MHLEAGLHSRVQSTPQPWAMRVAIDGTTCACGDVCPIFGISRPGLYPNKKLDRLSYSYTEYVRLKPNMEHQLHAKHYRQVAPKGLPVDGNWYTA